MEREIMLSKNKGALAVVASLGDITTLAQAFFESGMFPSLKKQAEAVVKIVAGAELSFPPLFSLLNIDVVLGKLRLNSQAIAALVKRSGRYDYQATILTNTECVLTFTDGGKDVYESRFSISDAQRAGLVKPGSGWVMYPKAMLFARAVSQGAKIVCPHLMAGAEPLEDSGYEEVDGEITKEGEPPPSAWRSFWAEAREITTSDNEAFVTEALESFVHNALGVGSVKDWLAAGHTFAEALDILRRDFVPVKDEQVEVQVQVQKDMDTIYGPPKTLGTPTHIPSRPPAVDASEPQATSHIKRETWDAIEAKLRSLGLKQDGLDKLKATLRLPAKLKDYTQTEGEQLFEALQEW